MTSFLTLLWVLLFPLGYYFMSYPFEHPIFTFDRMTIGALLIVALTAPRKTPITKPLRKSAIAWGLFVAAVAISMIDPVVRLDTFFAERMAVDCFVLPACLAWCVIRGFSVRRHIATLHLVISIMVIYTACIGILEMILGQDLLKFPTSLLTLAGSHGSFLSRPNGPFPASETLAILGFISICFLAFLRHVETRFSGPQKLLHVVATGSAFVCIALPLFRLMVLALVIMLLIDLRYGYLFRGSRLPTFAIISAIIIFSVTLKYLNPDAYEDRTDPTNIWGRVAENQLMLQIASEHPLTGVGFGRYTIIAKITCWIQPVSLG